MPSFRNELSINDQEIAAALVGEERRQQLWLKVLQQEARLDLIEGDHRRNPAISLAAAGGFAVPMSM